MNKSWIVTGLVIVALVIGGWLIWRQTGDDSGSQNSNSNLNTSGNQASATKQVAKDKTKGRLVVSFTDAATDMKNVTAIKMQVNSVEVRSATEGWITVENRPKIFSLLELDSSGKLALAGSIDADPGAYDRIRFEIGKIEVETSSGAKTEAKLPEGTFDVAARSMVKSGETSSVVIDVLASDSIHKTEDNEYVFAPVISLESRSDAAVYVNSNDEVTVEGGSVNDIVKAGMDIDGAVKLNFVIDAAALLDVRAGKIIEIDSATKGGLDLKL